MVGSLHMHMPEQGIRILTQERQPSARFIAEGTFGEGDKKCR
jgi:hypothetical protein